jgi:hypothetical protein
MCPVTEADVDEQVLDVFDKVRFERESAGLVPSRVGTANSGSSRRLAIL